MGIDKNTIAFVRDNGFILFPMEGLSKKPLMKGFRKVEYDPNLPIGDCNYGVNLNHRVLVIDIDPRNFEEGCKPFDLMCKDLGLDKKATLQTYIIRTPRGGYHIWYANPNEVIVKRDIKRYKGLEFITCHIMCPGSYIPEYEAGYTHISGDIIDLQYAPDGIIQLVKKQEPLQPTEPVESNNQSDKNAFITYIRNTPAAISGDSGDNATFSVACKGRDFGLSEDTTLKIMKNIYNPSCVPPWSTDQLKSKVANAYQYASGTQGVESLSQSFDEITPEQIIQQESLETKQSPYAGLDVIINPSTGEVKIKRTGNNLRILLTEQKESPLKDMIKFNAFTDQIQFVKKPEWNKKTDWIWEEDDLYYLKGWLSEKRTYEASINAIYESVRYTAIKNMYHPVREYLEYLVWDQKPRLSFWLHSYCGSTHTDINSFIGRTTLIAAVKRVFEPGCKFDHVLVLEGDQGLGKSSVCSILGGKWFTDSQIYLKNSSQNAVETMGGHWIVEMAELDKLIARDTTDELKRFITSSVDTCRKSYRRDAQGYPRQNIFIGTVNRGASGYLRDSTGSRRFWPVKVNKINFKGLISIRDQLWAEAYQCYLAKEPIHVYKETLRDQLANKNEDRNIIDPWFGTIMKYMNENYRQYIYKDKEVRITITEIYEDCLGGRMKDFTVREDTRICICLTQLGFKAVLKSLNKKTFKIPVQEFI